MKHASIDKTLIVMVIFLVVIGLIAVYSATSVLPSVKPEYAEKDGMIYLKKQIFTLIIGFFLMILFIFLSSEKLKKLVFPLLIISFIMAVAVFTPLGVSAGGAKRWLSVWLFVFQPSELVKLATVFFLAWFLSRPGYNPKSLIHFLIPILLIAVFQFIFLKQPDFGAVVILGIITFLMLFIRGVSLKLLGASTLVAIPIVFYFVKEPYRWKRITSFFDPWADPQGSSFQLVQSLVALGSGGLTGRGLGEGKQKLAFLPEIHTDFIFAHIGEEMGFIGAFIVVIVFFLIFMRGFRIAQQQSTPFNFYLASGITTMISIQALINFAVVTGLTPTKGLTLPFVSYGGSSLVVNLMAVGVLLNLSRNKFFSVVQKPKLRTYRYWRGR